MLLTDEAAKGLWLEADAVGLASSDGVFRRGARKHGQAQRLPSGPQLLTGLEWDGIERLDTWLSAFLDAEDTELNRAYGRKTLIGAVRRVRAARLQSMIPCLCCKAAKARASRRAICALCPDEDWFTDSLGIGDEQKEVIEHTAGKWLVEMAELAGMGKRDANQAKAMISRKVDRARLSYGALEHRAPAPVRAVRHGERSAVFARPTGNRRYWPVSISGRARSG